VNCAASGLLVVDCDVKGAVDGLTAWLALGARHGPPVDTRVVSTGGGGEHWYFTTEPGCAIGNSAGRLAPGIDVRGRGGYVVAPPSVVAGSSYDVVTARPPASAPEWLIGLLVEPVTPTAPGRRSHAPASSYARAALEGELGRLAVAEPGERNDTLVRAAYRLGQLVGSGQLDATYVSAQLLVVAQRIGLSRVEAQRTIASGLAAGAANPRRAA
jgi:hypothetical protein